MIAIRGAVTVERDSPEEIKESVNELLVKIKEKNGIAAEDIICIMFSNTGDLRSYYPAKAAREAGFFSCALYSSLEPEIEGSLPRCVRVMVLAEKTGKANHVYLRGASNLRKDLSKILNIAIDGPAGSGKSTIAKIIANKLDILYLDTGAMYRACALACLRASINYEIETEVENLLKKTDIDIKYEDGMQKTLISGEDISECIRTPEISMIASKISAYAYVRNEMVRLQRVIASRSSCVLDGRDIGTNVLPNAEHKFYMNADAKIRADRRMKENLIKGIEQPFNEVLEEIIKRDEQDKIRKIAPLKRASDAIEIDTGKLTIDEVAQLILKHIQGSI